jgi:DNA-binding MltR family transcriptional regulator
MWKEYLETITDRTRKDQLNDTRTYSAAVRIELLYTIGRMPAPLYESITRARKRRNELVHHATITLEKDTEGLAAMKQIIEFVCETSVKPPMANDGISW